jgi:hypothetical protein
MMLLRTFLTILDLPMRWLMGFFDSVIGDRGYLTVGSIVGAYLVMFGLIDQKHQQEARGCGFVGRQLSRRGCERREFDRDNKP